MEPIKGYEKAEVLGQREKLPVGGYVLKIHEVGIDKYDWGSVFKIAFDISEGEYKGFFKKDFAAQPNDQKKWRGVLRMTIPSGDGTSQDDFNISKFKTNIRAIEESNSGFKWDWDENKLVGKSVGAIFRDAEYDFDGRKGFYTECYGFISSEKIHDGNFKIPAPKMLKEENCATNSDTPVGFEEIDDLDFQL